MSSGSSRPTCVQASSIYLPKYPSPLPRTSVPDAAVRVSNLSEHPAYSHGASAAPLAAAAATAAACATLIAKEILTPAWCVMQVFHVFPAIQLVQPPNTQSPGLSPCFPQRPLRAELVVQPATEHGFFLPPPCLKQCEDPEFALLEHPSNLHGPHAPCLPQTPRARASVAQPSSLHTFLLPPSCLPHRPLAWTALVQLRKEQIPLPPCLLHTPRA